VKTIRKLDPSYYLTALFGCLYLYNCAWQYNIMEKMTTMRIQIFRERIIDDNIISVVKKIKTLLKIEK